MKNYEKKIYIFIVFIIILVPLSFMPLFGKKSAQSVIRMEYRNAVTFEQVLDAEKPRKEFETYLADHLSFRKEMIYVWSYLNYQIGVSTRQDNVQIGKQGYLFIGNTTGTIDLYRNILTFTDQDMKNDIQRLLNLEGYLQSRDVDFLYIIAPNKYDIYPEYMPDWMTVSKNPNYVQTMIEHIQLEQQMQGFIALQHSLLDKKNEYEQYLYQKSDTHWTLLGGFLGYDAVIDKLNQLYGYELEKVSLLDYQIIESNGMELSRTLGLMDRYDDYSVSINTHPEQSITPVFLTENKTFGGLRKSENPQALNDMTVLFLRDSFYAAMEKELNNTFTTVYDMHYFQSVAKENGNKILSELLDQYKPDLVMIETIARTLPLQVNKLPDSYE